MTDVTNASRTMLMNINSLKWDPTLFEYVYFVLVMGLVLLFIVILF